VAVGLRRRGHQHGARRGAVSPRPATSPEETHAGLIVSTDLHEDVDLRLRMRTVAQLREGEPNPWEVGWAVWAYSDPTHFYYLALKPNGCEIGKADPAYPGNQRSGGLSGEDRAAPPSPHHPPPSLPQAG
jgi:hypothetical protein